MGDSAYEKSAEAADTRMARVEALAADILADLARKPTVACLCDMVGVVVGVAASLIVVFVGVLIYLASR